jgi:hypothetical protein
LVRVGASPPSSLVGVDAGESDTRTRPPYAKGKDSGERRHQSPRDADRTFVTIWLQKTMLRRLMSGERIGLLVKATLLRDGEERTLTVVSEELVGVGTLYAPARSVGPVW